MTDVPETAKESTPAAGRLLSCTDPETATAAVAEAVEAVRRGACVVLPTDTVYGIGADAFSPEAVQRLLAAKGRGRDMPPPVLIGDPTVLMALGRDIPDAAKKLAEQFWPGALTLIVHAQSSLRMDLGDTEGTIAVRVPDHDLARELLRASGPMAVSSANLTGQPAAVTAEAAHEQLGDRVDVYLDAGPTLGQQASTIVDFTTSDYGVVVRPGLVPVDALREVVPYLAEDVPEPAVAETEPVVEEAEPAVAESEPAMAKPEHAATEPEPAVGEAEPAATETGPAVEEPAGTGWDSITPPKPGDKAD